MTKVDLIRGDATQRWSLEGDSCREELDDNSLDSIVTDPPYGIAFMGKTWDDMGGPAAYQAWTTSWAREAHRCLKPGGFLLAFGSTRMSHRMACGFEDAGFEIIDTIEWLYLTGFPKAGDIGKLFDKRAGATRKVVGEREQRNPYIGSDGLQFQSAPDYAGKHDYITAPSTPLAQRWDGWKTAALKPAHEPIIVARKPLSEKTYVDNIEKWGVGAINVDGCKIGGDTIKTCPGDKFKGDGIYGKYATCEESFHEGRFPANVVTLEPDEWYSPYFNITSPTNREDSERNVVPNVTPQELSKKAPQKERKVAGVDVQHPTQKPVVLVRWLQRLVTPPGGTTAPPFLGSGTDAVAAILEGFSFWGMELSEEYWPIIEARVAHARTMT